MKKQHDLDRYGTGGIDFKESTMGQIPMQLIACNLCDKLFGCVNEVEDHKRSHNE